MNTEILKESEVPRAAELVKEGKLVAFPTETVYGLGASVFLPDAILKIFEVKGRPQDNPLIAHIADLSDVEKLASDVPPIFYSWAERYFPGPITFILKKAKEVPSIVSAGLDTIAIRMPEHPLAKSLIREVGEPIVAPSANVSGRPSSTTIDHVLSDFDRKIAAAIDGGACQYGMESTVVDLVSFEKPTLLRRGAIDLDIEEYSKGPKSSPGMKYRHYAPDLPVFLFRDQDAFEEHCQGKESRFVIRDPAEKSLYALLRQAETENASEVVIYASQPLSPTLENRLEKILSL